MSNNIKIISDSACDASVERAKSDNIELIPFSVSFDEENYLKEHIDISVDDFYKKINSKDIFPKTSLPSIQLYLDAFESGLKKGQDILCICLSSKLSGSYQSALNAKNILLENYPKNKIVVIDSILATYPQYYLALMAKELAEENVSIEEIEKILNEKKNKTRIFLTLDSLEYLKKGGRLGKGAALASGILNIKPVLEVADGELYPKSKVRGIKKAFATIVDESEKYANSKGKGFKVTIIYSGDKDIAIELASTISDRLSVPFDEITVNRIGITICSHTGPDVIGIAISY